MDRNEAAAIIDSLQDAQAALYGRSETGPVRAVLVPDVLWTVPGRSPIAGTYRGADEVIAYMLARRELAGGTFTMTRRALMTGDEHVAALTDGHAQIGGASHTWSTVGLYEIAGSRITSCRLIPFDQEEFDAIWSASA